MMNMDYDSAFFGKNILAMQPSEERALIGNYQKLRLYVDNTLSILSPKRRISQQINPAGSDPEEVELDQVNTGVARDIAYYQGASYIYHQHLNAWKQERTIQ